MFRRQGVTRSNSPVANVDAPDSDQFPSGGTFLDVDQGLKNVIRPICTACKARNRVAGSRPGQEWAPVAPAAPNDGMDACVGSASPLGRKHARPVTRAQQWRHDESLLPIGAF